MPTVRQMLIACSVAVPIALVVAFALRAVGLGEHATLAAGVSAGVSASIVTMRLRACATNDEALGQHD